MHRILVVEDDKLIRWSLKEIFTQEGYQVDVVDTIKEALNRAANNAYNLIFADIEMSEKTGIDILQEIDKLQPLTKIVILSAYARNQIEPFLGTLKIFSVVEKPFNAEQIKMIAKEALGS